jgi:urea transport system ATP-binding protein
MLAIQDLHVAYGQSEVLHGLNVNVAANEIVAIMGRNGMGKTTLMKSLMGILSAKSGSIAMDGAELSPLKSYERVAKGLAYVPQGRMIFSTMTVKENIETGLVVSGETEVPGSIYELFPVLLEMKSRRGGNLSGGQQQQLAIGRALASNPTVLLLDEPSLGLAPKIVDIVFEALTRIRDAGVAVLLVEQRAQRTVALADESYVLANGELRLTLGPKDAGDTDRLVAAYLA